jgi:hypothetical protein
MTTNETPGPLGTQPDRFLEDISADELSTNAPIDETNDDKNARRERNRRRNEWRRCLRESLPIRNLTEALNQVESQVHTTPKQCLMSITTIARQAQGMHAGEVIAKHAEDAYFIRVDNRFTQVPPLRTRKADHEATSRSRPTTGVTVLEESYCRTQTALGNLLEDLLRAATVQVAMAEVMLWWLVATPAVEGATAGAPHTGLEGEPMAEAIAEAEAT